MQCALCSRARRIVHLSPSVATAPAPPTMARPNLQPTPSSPPGMRPHPVTAAATTTPEAADDSSSSSSSNVPVIVGSVGAVAGAVLIGLGVMILRRRTAQNKNDVRAGLPPPASATGMHAEDTPGRANRQHHARRSAASSAVVGGANGQRRSYEQSRLPPAAGGSHQRDIAPPSYYEMVVGALGGRDGDVESGTSKSKTKGAAMGGGAFIHGGPRNSNDRHEAERSLTASISTGGVSTEERADELARFRRGRTNNDAASRSDGRKKDASRGERRRNSSPPEAGEMRKPSSDVGIGQAAMDAAQELASQSSVPGVRWVQPRTRAQPASRMRAFGARAGECYVKGI